MHKSVFFFHKVKTSQSFNLSLYEKNKHINYRYLFYFYLNSIAVPFAVRPQCNTSYKCNTSILSESYILCQCIVELWPKTVSSNNLSYWSTQVPQDSFFDTIHCSKGTCVFGTLLLGLSQFSFSTNALNLLLSLLD